MARKAVNPTAGDFESRTRVVAGGGHAAVADEAVATSRRLHDIVGRHRERLHAREDATVLSLRLFEQLPQHPMFTVSRAASTLGCSRPAAGKALGVLEAAGVVQPLDARKKNRTLVFEEYVACLREGTEVDA